MCFHPPPFYGALRRSRRLSARGDELGSFPFGSSVSNRSLISHKKVSVATASRGKCLQAAVTTMFSVRFWRKGNVLVVNIYFSSPVGFRRAVAKMRTTGRTLWNRKCFHPPVFYGALRRVRRLSAGGDEFESFPFGSPVSKKESHFPQKMSVGMAGRRKWLQAAVTSMFSVRFWKKCDVLLVSKYFSQGGSEKEKNWPNPPGK